MANVLRLFLAPEDERSLFRSLARHRLEVYPVRVPPGWKPFIAEESTVPRLPEDALYLAAAFSHLQVDKVKRGPDKGHWRVDEVRSPVIFYERSRLNEEAELLAGRLWAELDVTPQTGRRDAAPDRFRRLFLELEEWLKKNFRRSEPVGHLIGPAAARDAKAGRTLREATHRGGTVRPFR